MDGTVQEGIMTLQMYVLRYVGMGMSLVMKIVIMEVPLLMAGDVELDVNQELLMDGTVRMLMMGVVNFKLSVLRFHLMDLL